MIKVLVSIKHKIQLLVLSEEFISYNNHDGKSGFIVKSISDREGIWLILRVAASHMYMEFLRM